MTYIMFETVPGNDPRLVPEIEIIGSDWHFSFARVTGTPQIDWLNPTTITEDMFHARMFTNALNGEVGIMRSTSNPADIIQPTSFGDNDYEKVAYRLTSIDEANTVALLKAQMLNWAENNFDNDSGLVQIKAQVPGLARLEETQTYMSTYFEWDCAFTAGTEKTPQFETKKFSQVIFPD